MWYHVPVIPAAAEGVGLAVGWFDSLPILERSYASCPSQSFQRVMLGCGAAGMGAVWEGRAMGGWWSWAPSGVKKAVALERKATWEKLLGRQTSCLKLGRAG